MKGKRERENMNKKIYFILHIKKENDDIGHDNFIHNERKKVNDENDDDLQKKIL